MHTGKRNGKFIFTRKIEKQQKLERKREPSLISINPSHINNEIDESDLLHRKNDLNLLLHGNYFQDRKDLTPEEKEAIISYQEDSTEINKYLRGIKNDVKPDIVKKINNIKTAFSRNESIIHKKMFLYKGISAEFAKIIIENNSFKDRGFFSSSFDPTKAITYANKSDREKNVKDSRGYTNILVYMFPGGKAMFLGNHAEILLPDLSEWRIFHVLEVYNLHSVQKHINTMIRRKIRLIYIERIGDTHE